MKGAIVCDQVRNGVVERTALLYFEAGEKRNVGSA